jgi:hypothetical protein
MQSHTYFGGWAKALGIVLLFGLVFSGTASAAHFHPLDAGQDTHCQMCLLAHQPALPTTHAQLLVVHATIAAIRVAPEVPVVSRTILSARIRPPPTSL